MALKPIQSEELESNLLSIRRDQSADSWLSPPELCHPPFERKRAARTNFTAHKHYIFASCGAKQRRHGCQRRSRNGGQATTVRQPAYSDFARQIHGDSAALEARPNGFSPAKHNASIYMAPTSACHMTDRNENENDSQEKKKDFALIPLAPPPFSDHEPRLSLAHKPRERTN